MSIVTAPLLFCEGKPDSLDARVLSMLKYSKVTIVPAGGKYGIGNFALGRISSYPKPPAYLVFRDRDFDAEPPDSACLIAHQANKPMYCSYRACIESYLLDAALIRRYWIDSSQGPAWKHGLPMSEAEIGDWIIQAARHIADYQAVRWALAKLKPGPFWPQVKNTWKSDGSLPNSLTFADCTTEAENLISSFHTALAPVTIDNFRGYSDDYRSRFSSREFWENHNYLVWFHGKDLKKSMQRLRPTGISLNHYCEWAAEKLDISNVSSTLFINEL